MLPVRLHFLPRFAVAALTAATLLSCSSSDRPTITAPTNAREVQVYDLYGPEVGFISVGKWSGPPGTYTFKTTVAGGGDYQLGGDGTRVFSFSVPITAETGTTGYAYLQANESTWPAGTTAAVTVGEELIPAGVQVDSIRLIVNGVDQPAVTHANSVTLNVGYTDIVIVEFFNGSIATPPPPPGPREACNALWWKQVEHFDSWAAAGLGPLRLVGSQFVNASMYRTALGRQLSSFTLIEALNARGSSSVVGAAKILLRAGTAALLNAKHPGVDYRRTPAAITEIVNTALATGNRDKMLIAAIRLHNLNHGRGGCPLD